MKKIVPFSKDIVFNTDVYEINSISLEHNLKLNSDNNINGEFILSGDYKESEIVIKNEPFIYNIPFDIELDDKYIVDNIKIEIEDFNYDLISNNTMNISIKVLIDNLEEKEEIDPIIEVLEEEERPVKVDIEEENDINDESPNEVTSIFNNFSDKDEKYVNYYVHIYRENDSIENIIKQYNVTKEELDEYNNLSTVTIGSKIIIPNNE